MGLAMGATILAIVLSPWGKQSGAHFNPAVTFTFYRLRKVALWDAVFYCAAQFAGRSWQAWRWLRSCSGRAGAQSSPLRRHLPGIYGDAIAFVAELVISFILMRRDPVRVQSRSSGALHALLCRHPGWVIHCV